MKDDIVRHVLVARFREDTPNEQIQAFFDKFRELSRKIEGIVSFEYGENNSREGLDRGLTHVIIVTFASVQARDGYLPHPEHRKFIAWFSPLNILEELLVVDYIPQS